ncbi:MAG TPA: DUF2442 domain-containing protein [Candidatus Kapabacteria bacterium]|nr:DUF2442 domain-containing protein [Candidatus Kapabacteria bacterium]
MRIKKLTPMSDLTLSIVSDDGRVGIFNVAPYLELEAFAELKNNNEFMKVINGGYFVEWECGADLSADTIEAKMKITERLSGSV